MELPPRARRILKRVTCVTCFLGTTSACAENTERGRPDAIHHGNYLRVRGEYSQKPYCRHSFAELPPRARRILNEVNRQFGGLGTTSACAENTGQDRGSISPHRNYLRVRGEYTAASRPEIRFGELPPRARRIHRGTESEYSPWGTTSACAENTWRCQHARRCPRNYLRVRGEYLAPPTTPML